jgi:hypothetical protein
LYLKDAVYFAAADSAGFLLSHDGLVQLEATVATDVIDVLLTALRAGRSFDEALAELPVEKHAPAGEFLAVMQDQGLMWSRQWRSPAPALLPQCRLDNPPLVLTGDVALANCVAEALRACEVEVRVAEPAFADAAVASQDRLSIVAEVGAGGKSPMVCHVAVDDAGVCWSVAEDRGESSIPLPQAAFRRAAAHTLNPPSVHAVTHPVPGANVMTIAASQIAQFVIRRSESRPPMGTVTYFDKRTLSTTRHHVTVHPFDLPAKQQDPSESHRNLAESRTLSPQELTDRFQLLSGGRFAAFAALDNAEFCQLPLKVVQARGSDPCKMLSTPPTVLGVGVDQDGAVEQAILQALPTYGSIVVDPRLLLDEHGAFLCGSGIDPTHLLGNLRRESVVAFAPAIELGDAREVLLPATRVFPVLRTGRAQPLPCGSAAGRNWRDALTHGLLQHCVRLTVSVWALRGRQAAVLPVEELTHDPGVQYLVAMARAAGIDLTLRDITGPLGVPVVACTSTSAGTVYGGGADLVDAIRETLTATLFRYQVLGDPVLRIAANVPAPAVWTSHANLASLGPDRLAEALRSLGHTPSVATLDHDQAVSEAFPYVLRVVI